MPDAYQQIVQLLYIYAERLDLGDLQGVAELFRQAKIVSGSRDNVCDGYEAVLEMYTNATRLYEDGTPHTKHVITNPIIEIGEDTDHASARSYFTVYQSLADFPLQAIITGRYHDQFVCQDGLWRFAERNMLPEQFGDLSRHLLFDANTMQ